MISINKISIIMGNNNSSMSESDKKALKVAGIVAGTAILTAVTFGTATAIIGTAGAVAKGASEYTSSRQTEERGESSNTPMLASSGGGGGSSISKTSSPVWQNLNPFRGNIRTNGLSGSSRSYFTWDYTHNHIEKYNHIGKHVGAIDPVTGNICEPAVPGRSIRL